MTTLSSYLESSWEMVIGLEVHAQISSKAKLFSTSPTSYGAQPNTQVNFVDAAFPGMLPVVNRRAIEAGVLSGLALGAKINNRSIFARKNYFYPDLPQGYQISQYEDPLVGKGFLEINGKKIGITRIHLEQDAGKSIHDVVPDLTLIDLNRSGVALMEIVTEPDISSPEEASAFVTSLRALLRSIKVCDGNMQEGSLRIDANVSVRKIGDPLGTRSEIKNLNSFRFMRAALEFEAKRQIELIIAGKEVVQETRLFDSVKGVTRPMRLKEEAHDYRYFPDPDLLPVEISDEYIESLRKTLPELPQERVKRYINAFGLKSEDAVSISQDVQMTEYYEAVLAKKVDPLNAYLWLRGELMSMVNRDSLELANCPVSPDMFANFLKMMEKKEITGKIGKEVLQKMWDEKSEAADIVSKYSLKTAGSEDEIIKALDKIIANNPNQLAAYLAGKTKLKGWFIGQIMQEFKGKADPATVNAVLNKRLK